MSNNRNFHASKEEPRSGNLMVLGLKHSEKDLLPFVDQLMLKVCYVEGMRNSTTNIIGNYIVNKEISLQKLENNQSVHTSIC